jgi:tRNA-binding protein
VVNFKAKQIANFRSECLILGIQNGKDVVLLHSHKNAKNGTKVS